MKNVSRAQKQDVGNTPYSKVSFWLVWEEGLNQVEEQMNYSLSISEAAIEQLRALAKEVRRNIGFRLESLCDNLQGDVKKLKGAPPRYRLRVGDYRVLFTLENQEIEVYAVKNRKEAYE